MLKATPQQERLLRTTLCQEAGDTFYKWRTVGYSVVPQATLSAKPVESPKRRSGFMPPFTQAGPGQNPRRARPPSLRSHSPSPLLGPSRVLLGSPSAGGGQERWKGVGQRSDRPGCLLECSLGFFRPPLSLGALSPSSVVRAPPGRCRLRVTERISSRLARAAVRRQRGRDLGPTRPGRAGRQAEGAGAAERAGPTPPKPAPRAVRTPHPAGRRARPPVRAGACRAGLRP